MRELITKNQLAFLMILTVLVMLNISCHSLNDKYIGEQKVLEFRKSIEQRDIDRIYDHASSDFKQSVSRPDFKKFVLAVADEIADSQNFELQQSKYSTDFVNGQLLILVYAPKVRGKVTLEEYIFKKENNDYLLYNYRFDSH